MKHNVMNIDTKEGFGRGNWSDLTNNLNLAFEPTGADPKDPKQPSHTVYAVVGERNIDIGSMWRNTVTQGPHTGQKYYSMELDDPSFQRELKLSTWPTGEADEWRLFWSRDKREQKAA